jgi:hypothetical protein
MERKGKMKSGSIGVHWGFDTWPGSALSFQDSGSWIHIVIPHSRLWGESDGWVNARFVKIGRLCTVPISNRCNGLI